jgi:hypothetical protein
VNASIPSGTSGILCSMSGSPVVVPPPAST